MKMMTKWERDKKKLRERNKQKNLHEGDDEYREEEGRE